LRSIGWKVPESVFRITIADSSISVFSPFREQAVSSGFDEQKSSGLAS
jgi:hypothetical protein